MPHTTPRDDAQREAAVAALVELAGKHWREIWTAILSAPKALSVPEPFVSKVHRTQLDQEISRAGRSPRAVTRRRGLAGKRHPALLLNSRNGRKKNQSR